MKEMSFASSSIPVASMTSLWTQQMETFQESSSSFGLPSPEKGTVTFAYQLLMGSFISKGI